MQMFRILVVICFVLSCLVSITAVQEVMAPLPDALQAMATNISNLTLHIQVEFGVLLLPLPQCDLYACLFVAFN